MSTFALSATLNFVLAALLFTLSSLIDPFCKSTETFGVSMVTEVKAPLSLTIGWPVVSSIAMVTSPKPGPMASSVSKAAPVFSEV